MIARAFRGFCERAELGLWALLRGPAVVRALPLIRRAEGDTGSFTF